MNELPSLQSRHIECRLGRITLNSTKRTTSVAKISNKNEAKQSVGPDPPLLHAIMISRCNVSHIVDSIYIGK